jgi:uncharacterized protein YggT (Ycf19 family)
VCIGIAFPPWVVAVVCLIYVLISVTDNEEGIEKVFDKNLSRENDTFLNVFHKMLFDGGLIVYCSVTLSLLLMFLNNWQESALGFTAEKGRLA